MGCGKTGRFLSSDYLGASRKPDLIALGKSISGGVYPASFVLGNAACMNLVETKEIISTYSFSPMAIAATTAALQVIDNEGLVQRAVQIQRLVSEELETWTYPFVDYVTIRGADFGIWLRNVDQNTCRRICELCMHNGLLVFPSQSRIRMSVAMIITDGELAKGLHILKKTFEIISIDLARSHY
jgi:ornithine--oxo-acid transaminase